jgi:gamma-glutamyltranspeptidase
VFRRDRALRRSQVPRLLDPARGLAFNGFSISDEVTETLEDGKPYTVQYFERARLESHPESAPPFDGLLGQFGRRIYNAR